METPQQKLAAILQEIKALQLQAQELQAQMGQVDAHTHSTQPQTAPGRTFLKIFNYFLF